jgi:hypothetical protein
LAAQGLKLKRLKRVGTGDIEEEEAATPSASTIYRRAEGLTNSILAVVGRCVSTFGRVWGVVNW